MFREVPAESAEDGPRLSAVIAAFTRLRRENDRLVASLARARGLSASDFRALAHVRTSPGLTPRGLADFLALSFGATTTMIDRLVASGYVVRSPNPRDGRSVRLESTESGIQAVDAATQLYVEAFERAVSRERHDEVAETFTQIARALSELAPQVDSSS